MASLGLEISKAEPGYRKKRFVAFLIDLVVIVTIIYIVAKITEKPNFSSVKAAQNAAKAGAAGPNAQSLANNMFSLFNAAFAESLFIGFLYEVITQLIFKGSTLGKLIMKLRIVPMNAKRNFIIHNLIMIIRSAIKFISIYIFQGFPFFIEVLSIFANKQSRAGYDIFVKTYVKDLREKEI